MTDITNNSDIMACLPCLFVLLILMGFLLFPLMGGYLDNYRNKQLEKEIVELSSNYDAVTNEYETLFDKQTVQEILDDQEIGGLGG